MNAPDVSTPARRRTPRPALAQAPVYRAVVSVLLVALGLATVLLLVLAAGVLLGVVPYPGR